MPGCAGRLTTKKRRFPARAGSSAAGATQGAGSSLLDVSDSTGAVGGAAIHPLECSFTIEAPITNSWGGSSYGPGLPPPPPVVGRRVAVETGREGSGGDVHLVVCGRSWLPPYYAPWRV